MTQFSDLGLAAPLLEALATEGYDAPTPIQAQAIPHVLAGKDLLGIAQTGTGKTAAFALPTLARLGKHEPRGPRVLILEPTRELAAQVETAFRDFGRFTDLRATVVHGGVGYGRQRSELQAGTDVVIATPGRLMDFLNERTLTLAHLKILILDEVDRMLDMGFLPDVKRIVAKVPKTRQTLFFTATLPPEIEQLAAWALRDPFKISVSRERSTAETISHAFYPVVQGQKFELLAHLLEQTQYHSVIIFSRTKSGADYVANRLKHAGHTCAVMHSDRSQQERVDALKGFKSGKHEVLVATDIAARGLDIAQLEAVINVDVTPDPEIHIHRIGRTGRGDEEGWALNLCSSADKRRVASIAQRMGFEPEWHALDELVEDANEPLQAPMTTLLILGGRKDKIRPADVLGALTGEAGFTREQVGKITVTDQTTYVAVERAIAREAVRRLSAGTLKGKKVKVRALEV